jgi:hypothetical protein
VNLKEIVCPGVASSAMDDLWTTECHKQIYHAVRCVWRPVLRPSFSLAAGPLGDGPWLKVGISRRPNANYSPTGIAARGTAGRQTRP